MIDRRAFLRLGGAAALTAAWQTATGCAQPGADSSGGNASGDAPSGGSGAAPDHLAFPLASIGVQLYTVRGVMERNLEQALEQVAGAGYRNVETAGLAGKTPAEFRALLNRHGLASPAGHWPLEMLESDPEGAMAGATALGQRYVVVPWLAESQRTSLDDYRRLADRLDRLGEQFRPAGLRIGYHNHDFEFATFGGQTPAYDVLVESTDPELVTLEADLYWMYKAGADPVAYFDRYPGRFSLCHVKDGTAAPEKRMVDVGAGAIDWRRIFAAADRAGLQYGFVEHDQPADPIETIRASRAHLATLLRSS